jgi:protein-L-isoaspartate(D-aspartate) O-methyltransferase
MSDPDYGRQRKEMVRLQIFRRGVEDPRVLEAMEKVPRHDFLPPPWKDSAYQDSALPLKDGQTVSQPYIVAFMTEALDLEPEHRVLEIGTGSGYQTAVLCEIAEEVCTVEKISRLLDEARTRLRALGYDSVRFACGDGSRGWPVGGGFDRIIVTAAARYLPEELTDQLVPGGKMVIPLGTPGGIQHLFLVRKDSDGTVMRERLLPVRFVPLVMDEHPS